MKRADIQAVFFWQSRLLHHKRPWEKVLQEGHKIGSHSHLHVNLAEKSFEAQYTQMKTSVDVQEKVTGRRPVLFRPPYGRYDRNTLKAASELGLQVVLWNLASLDWQLKKNPAAILDNVVHAVKPGSIILLHEYEQTLAVLEELIVRLKNENYSFSNDI